MFGKKQQSGKTPHQKKAAKPAKRSRVDARSRRTRDALGDALISLMQQQPFEQITVQHVLDRAGVGRATFYAHYSDKNDLFLSDADEFWASMASYLSRNSEQSMRVAPVRELFIHIAGARSFRASLQQSGKLHEIMQLGIGNFARGIEQRLLQVRPAEFGSALRRQAFAHSMAGALFSMLEWWLDRAMPETPEQMDCIYHELVWSGAAAAARHVPSAQRDVKPANSGKR
jgi:AcrR family transcriptional regulator